MRDFMLKEGPIKKAQITKLLRDGINLFSKHPHFQYLLEKEPNLIRIPEPIVIVGDIHGQYYDLVHMLEKAGDPGDINYLFLGDYVDRGIYGIEVVIALLCLKVVYSNAQLTFDR